MPRRKGSKVPNPVELKPFERDESDSPLENSTKTSPKENKVQFENAIESSSEEDAEETEGALDQHHNEEIEKYITSERENLTRLLAEFPEDTKLTRRKARELNHDIINLLQLGGIQADDDLSSLFGEDIDDEDDEEYQPAEEDYHSDELSTTCSDIDSQPRTPGDALTHDDTVEETQYDEEGVFKVPGEPPKTPKRSTTTQDENIARRTRSKISLTTTPIEAIGVPPDFSVDNYDPDVELDESWMQFLDEFQRPLSAVEEEEETDPEYVAPGRDTGDVEEVEDIPVTQDELDCLINEILLRGLPEECEYDDDEEETYNNTTNNNTNIDEYLSMTDTTSVAPPEPPDPNNVTTPNVQPMVILQTDPPMESGQEMVLGTDNQLYVLTHAQLRDLVPGLSLEKYREPITNPLVTIDVTVKEEELMEQIREYKDSYMEFAEPLGKLTPDQLRRFQIQLMKHVQLLGQNFIQTYCHPEFLSCSEFFLKKLRSLVDRSRKSQSLRYLCWNLEDMFKRCLDWQKELSADTAANREYVNWLATEKRNTKFHPLLMECMVTTKALIFSDMLPKMRPNHKKFPHVGEAELRLILWSFKELRERDPKKSNYSCAFAFIKHYAPWRTWKAIHGWFRIGRTPITDRFNETGEIPEIIPETMDIESYSDVTEPAQRPRGTLPKAWNIYVFSKDRIRRVYRDIVQPRKVDRSQKETPVKKQTQLELLKATEQEPLVTLDYRNFKAEFNLPATSTSTTLAIPHRPPKSKENRRPTPRRELSLGRRGLSLRQAQKLIEKLVNPLSSRKRCISIETIRKRKRLTLRLHRALQRLDDSYGCLRNREHRENSIPAKIFNLLKEFDIYTQLVATKMKEVVKLNGGDEGDRLSNAPAPKRAKLDDEVVMAKRSVEMNKRHQRVQRMHENNRLLLQPESETAVRERDSMFAWNFFRQVSDTYLSEGRPEKNKEFMAILTRFKPKDGVPWLYQKIEKLFLPDHRELLDLFMCFLLPGHAAQVGKFYEHFQLNSMYSLAGKLKLYNEKQPNQWKKILNVLNEMTMEQDMPMAAIKQRFLPLLKGNPLLIEWFLQLFPTEHPPEGQDNEFEELQTKNELPFEEIPAALVLAESGSDATQTQTSCPIKYMQGRIQYGNRYILPADLSFLATSYELTRTGGKGETTTTTTKGASASTPTSTGNSSTRSKGKRGAVGSKKSEKSIVGCIHAVGPQFCDETEDFSSGTSGTNSSLVTGQREEPLCDVATLKAHMNRLNPPMAVDATTTSSATGAEEAKISPKKPHEWKTIPIDVKTSKTTNKQPLSPKKGSPRRAQNETKRKRQSSTTDKTNRESGAKAAVETVKPVEDTRTSSGNDGGKAGTASTTETTESVIEWTREEDKLILEVVNGQQGKTEEQILEQLSTAIPSRSRSDIRTRFQFIINVLKKFTSA